jgi:hypothetical protein
MNGRFLEIMLRLLKPEGKKGCMVKGVEEHKCTQLNFYNKILCNIVLDLIYDFFIFKRYFTLLLLNIGVFGL